MIWQQWEGTATTVANPSTSLPGPLNTMLAQGHFGSRQFCSRPFWLKASLAQGHQMVVLVVVMTMVALTAIAMNDVRDGDDGDDEHGGRHR
jgi:hypothetical protein